MCYNNNMTLTQNLTLKIKKAFTLAEVLITLVIIGVIAALTIPSAIAKFQKTQTVNQLKQVFSQFNQAVRMATAQHGDTATWDYSLRGIDFFNTYLTGLVKVEEKDYNQAEVPYKAVNGNSETGLTCFRNDAKLIVLNSGVRVHTDTVTPSSVSVTNKRKCYVVDINGLKAPNKFGRDAFMICLDGVHGTVIPHHSDDSELQYVEKTRDELKNGPSANSYQCNKSSGRGMWCAALIVNDGWQIKDDYPW